MRTLSLNHILSPADLPDGEKKYGILDSVGSDFTDIGYVCPCNSGGKMVMGAESQPIGGLAVRAAPLGSWLPSYMGVNENAGVLSALTTGLKQIGHRNPS